MTPEQRAALERRRERREFAIYPHDQWIKDLIVLADGFDAKHPVDDAVLVDVEWVQRVGFEQDANLPGIFEITGIAHAETRHCITILFLDDWDTIWSVNGVRFQQVNPRRGEVRRLAAVLGVPLKEPP